MTGPVKIVHVEKDGDEGLIATLSDGTTAAIVVEELLELRPHREFTRQPLKAPPQKA
jgi:hypothetical protein